MAPLAVGLAGLDPRSHSELSMATLDAPAARSDHSFGIWQIELRMEALRALHRVWSAGRHVFDDRVIDEVVVPRCVAPCRYTAL